MIIIWIIVGLLVVSFGLVVLRGAPYVPTHRKQLKAAFSELYPVSKKDVVVDLGSGDGVVCLEVAKKGSGAIGYELNPFLALFSYLRLRKYQRTKILIKDFMQLSALPTEVTVVYAFTTAHSIGPIGRKMQQWSIGRTLYFISYGFLLPNASPLRSHGPMHLYQFEAGKSKT